MNIFTKTSIVALLLGALAPFTHAEEKTLDIEKAEKFEVRHSMIGARNTVIFYTFADQQAVLRVTIDNKTNKFPLTAVIHKFADDVTAEGLKKWLNNQHSDGLYPEVPEPVSTYKIPAESLSTTEIKQLDNSQQPNGVFENYSITFEIKEFTEKDVLTLKVVTGETSSFLMAK